MLGPQPREPEACGSDPFPVQTILTDFLTNGKGSYGKTPPALRGCVLSRDQKERSHIRPPLDVAAAYNVAWNSHGQTISQAAQAAGFPSERAGEAVGARPENAGTD